MTAGTPPQSQPPPTPTSPTTPTTPATPATVAAHRRRREGGIDLDCGAGPDIRHVGIVFVHGIGSQQAGETLLDWGGAVIQALLDVRVGHKASADPVIDSQLDPAPGKSRFIELQLPATEIDGEPVPEQHWVMTEAWWAQRVRPPSFGQMAEWLGPRGAIERIVRALLPRARGEHDPRLRSAAEGHTLRRADDGEVEEDVAHGPPEGMKTEPNPVLREPKRFAGQLYLQAISALILVLYGTLRSIEKLLPIGPLRNGALTRPIDDFMLEWFGDVYVLLGDPAQAASVRGRLIDALSDLHSVHCNDVTVIAHSGGAIVSYMTLADQASSDLKVDRLITLGEGLNLAWRLTGAQDPKAIEQAAILYERLYTTVLDTRSDLRWYDFWASQDPAPVGALQFPRRTVKDPARQQALDAKDKARLKRVESRCVWNRLSFGDDHGTYWENDEEFLVPVLRLLEGRPTRALFGDASRDADRSNHRRRRLSILSLWRQLSMVATTSAVVVAFLLGSRFVARAGDAVAGAWNALPGKEVVAEPLNTLRALALADGGATFVAEIGVWLIAAVIGLATAYSLIAPPERPIPWAKVKGREWVGTFMRFAPRVVGALMVLALGSATVLFVTGATPAGAEAGQIVAALIAVLAIAIVVPAILRTPPDDRVEDEADAARPTEAVPAARAGDPDRSSLREGWDIVRTTLVMIFAGFLVLAPIVAIVAFDEVGRTVLGVLVVAVAFQVVGRIGRWRWSVWDARERMAARTGATYPSVRRVVAQGALLFAIVAALFLAVIFNADWLLLATGLGIGLAVLVGVSVDVIDAARQDRRTPADSLLRRARAAQSNW